MSMKLPFILETQLMLRRLKSDRQARTVVAYLIALRAD